jgi:hypothetical protein
VAGSASVRAGVGKPQRPQRRAYPGTGLPSPGRGRVLPQAWLLACAALASAVLTGYGAVQVAAGGLVLSGAVRPAGLVDWTALRWHVAVWDAWFLAWGISLAAATVARWRQAQRRPAPGRAESSGRPAGGEQGR